MRPFLTCSLKGSPFPGWGWGHGHGRWDFRQKCAVMRTAGEEGEDGGGWVGALCLLWRALGSTVGGVLHPPLASEIRIQNLPRGPQTLKAQWPVWGRQVCCSHPWGRSLLLWPEGREAPARAERTPKGVRLPLEGECACVPGLDLSVHPLRGSF